MRIAHLADTHLGYKQYNLDEREQDIYDAFNQVIDKAIEERVDVIIHSGDLFERSHPPIKALLTLKDALKKIGGKIKFLSILGEHDIPKRKAIIPHKLFDIHLLGANYKLQTIKIDNVLFAGISNLKGRYVGTLKEEIKRFDKIAEDYKHSVLILHQAIKKYLPFEGAYQLTLDELPRKASYYALGHIHAKNELKFGNGLLAYSGSTEIMSKDEISSWKNKGKGFYLVDLESDDINYEFIPLDIRPQVSIELNVANIEKILDSLIFNKKPLLHLKIFGETIDKSYVQEQIERMVRDKVIFHRVLFREAGKKEVKIPKDAINLLSIFKEYFEKEEIGEFAKNLYDILSEGDINFAINLAKNFMEEYD